MNNNDDDDPRKGMSEAKVKAAEDVATETDDAVRDDDAKISVNHGEESEQNEGEQSVSGTAPDPEADDDTLENAHDVGEQLDEDEEHAKELDLGSDIDKAEEHTKTH
jgi:hypothetical protein